MGLRQLIPASSRSFWQLYGEIENLQTGMDAIQQRLTSLESNIISHDYQMKNMFFDLMRKDDESLDCFKQRYYSEMPAATGSLRLFQLGSAKLLSEFNTLCSEHNLSYWAAFGTLLGAVRHKGFIPWDDDIDLCMMREDIDELVNIANNSERYKVTIVFDRLSFCKQVRFCYRDERLPCFLDLFIFDYVSDIKLEVFEKMNRMRIDAVEDMRVDETLAFWNDDNPFINVESPKAAPLISRFTELLDSQKNAMPELCDKASAEGVMWGIDNVFDFNKYQWICKLKDIFPLESLEFEGEYINAPASYLEMLEGIYGDIYTPPLVSNTYKHVLSTILESNDFVQAVKELLNS